MYYFIQETKYLFGGTDSQDSWTLYQKSRDESMRWSVGFRKASSTKIKAFGSSLSYAFVYVSISSCVSGLSSWHNPIQTVLQTTTKYLPSRLRFLCNVHSCGTVLHSLDLFWSTSIFLKVSKAHSSCQSFLPNFSANPSFCRAAPCNQPFMAKKWSMINTLKPLDNLNMCN